MKQRYYLPTAAAGFFIAAGSVLCSFPSLAIDSSGKEEAGVTRYVAQTGKVQPNAASQLQFAAAPLRAAQYEELLQKKFNLRYMGPPVGPGAGRARALEAGPETQLPNPQAAQPQATQLQATQFIGDPSLLVIGRNNKNTNANGPLGSTLAEPAAANNAMRVFAAGNFSHAEVSTNGGSTWTDVPLPGGPAAAPINCCDHDVIIDDARRVMFHSDLYINAGQTNGIVRIFVRRTPPAADCSYDISAPNNDALFDFPKLGLTKRFLYLTINAVGAGGGFARIVRFNIDQMSDCVAATTSSFTQLFTVFGQRVWRPAEGTNNIEAAYWGQLNNSTTFRIFRWKEADAAPTSVDRVVETANYTQPDCRGGVGNFNWIDSVSASGIGFRTVGAAAPGANGGPGYVGFWWQAGADAVHTQGHIRAAIFSLADFTVLSQQHIFNNTVCFGGPNVTANKRGDFGMSLASGGKVGGGGTAAYAVVGIDDEFTAGIGAFQFVYTAGGTHNRSDARYGDYFTIHPYEPCEKWFSATNYTLVNGAAAANVNSRYVEFGRQQSLRCYQAHSNQLPAN